MNPSTPPAVRPDASLDEEAQAREHEAFMRALDPAIAAAAEWHTRREDGLSAAEEAEFQQWLGADASHAGAYAGLDRGIGVLRDLPAQRVAHLRAQADAPSTPPAPRRPHGPPGRSASRWSGFLPSPAAFAVGCAMLLVAVMGWQQWQEPTFVQRHATQRGQGLTVPLPDGSELTLDAATRTDVALYRDRREVRLEEGQAMFSVAPDPGKPFRVLAGPARITVVGTRFAVRHTAHGSQAGGVEVVVEEGRVAVDGTAHPASPAAAGPAAMLTAGQMVRIDATGAVGAVGAAPSSGAALWRKGLVRFSNAPLSDVIVELERYGPTGLVVVDPQVAGLRIGGTYRIARPGELARLLPQMLPVELRPRSDGKREVVGAR